MDVYEDKQLRCPLTNNRCWGKTCAMAVYETGGCVAYGLERLWRCALPGMRGQVIETEEIGKEGE